MKNLKKIAAGGFLLALVLGGCASPVEDSGPVSPPPSVETVARPAADPAAVLGATKALGSTVTLSSATPGAAIYYTTDGSDPGAGSTRYTSPISLTRAYTPIRAIAVKSGMNDSEILTAEYWLQQGSYVDGLRAAPGNGGGYPWSSPISPIRVARGSVVDLACNTTGADIYYTTNGSTPGVTSPVFNPAQGITIYGNTTVKAVAVKPGLGDSVMLIEEYIVADICAFWEDDVSDTISTSDWATQVSASPGQYSVAYGNGRWIAAGPGANGAYSDDGVTWTALNGGWTTIFGSETINSVASGSNNRWVAVGSNGKGAYSTNNGESWTALNGNWTTIFGSETINSVASGSNNRWVAVGSNGKGAYSTNNGQTWNAINSWSGTFNTESINSVASGEGYWVAAGSSGRGAYSGDGATWTAIAGVGWTNTFNAGSINSVAWGDNHWVAVGSNGTGGKGAYSTDGQTWNAITWVDGSNYATIQTNTTANTYGTAINSAAYGDGRWLAAWTDASSSGVTWTKATN